MRHTSRSHSALSQTLCLSGLCILVTVLWRGSLTKRQSNLPNFASKGSTLSVFSMLSVGSAGSILSFGSAGSILSIGSAGSILSIGSAGSILSFGSAGSILSIRSAGSILSIDGNGTILNFTDTNTHPSENSIGEIAYH